MGWPNQVSVEVWDWEVNRSRVLGRFRERDDPVLDPIRSRDPEKGLAIGKARLDERHEGRMVFCKNDGAIRLVRRDRARR